MYRSRDESEKKKKCEKQNNKITDTRLVNILGSYDRMIDSWENNNTFVIRGGGHFMVYERAEEINEIINTILTELK